MLILLIYWSNFYVKKQASYLEKTSNWLNFYVKTQASYLKKTSTIAPSGGYAKILTSDISAI